MMHCENLQIPRKSSPFLKVFLRTDRVWDEAAKGEWADDVERRLREVRSQIDPRPRLLGYTVRRFKNSVIINTVISNEASKQEIAALTRGRWPFWDKIVKAVPEFNHSRVQFDACKQFEWLRVWDVEVEISRFRLEHGVFE
jgi:hypothetical protein